MAGLAGANRERKERMRMHDERELLIVLVDVSMPVSGRIWRVESSWTGMPKLRFAPVARRGGPDGLQLKKHRADTAPTPRPPVFLDCLNAAEVEVEAVSRTRFRVPMQCWLPQVRASMGF